MNPAWLVAALATCSAIYPVVDPGTGVSAPSVMRGAHEVEVQVASAATGAAELFLETPAGPGVPSKLNKRRFLLVPGNNRFSLPLPDALSPVHWTLDMRTRRFSPVGWVGTFGRGEVQFTHPQSVTEGPGGRLYVVDSGNDRIQVLSDRLSYLFEFGGFTFNAGGSPNELDQQRFDEPYDAVVTINRDIYITDRNNSRVVHLDRDGRYVGAFGQDSRLRVPRGIAGNSRGEVLVADTDNDQVQIFDRDGRFVFRIGTFGHGERQFQQPRDVSVDLENNIYVADTLNDRVQVFDQFGKLLSIFGGEFRRPQGIRADSDGFVWVVDSQARQVLRYTPAGHLVERLGNPLYPLENPTDVVEVEGGALYIVDAGHSALLRVDAACTQSRQEGSFPAPGKPVPSPAPSAAAADDDKDEE
jgi:DNA-binding beta-propeller fold protein YncE